MLREQRLCLVGAELADDLLKLGYTHLRGAKHGAQVPVQEFRTAGVDHQQLPEIVANFAALD